MQLLPGTNYFTYLNEHVSIALTSEEFGNEFLAVLITCDDNPNVVGWSNEEIIIPYLSPVDGRWHRYFPDFYVKVRNRQGLIESRILEVKPKSQSVPPKVRGKVTRQYLKEVAAWGVNEAKWKAAEEYCKDRNWKFNVITEEQLGI